MLIPGDMGRASYVMVGDAARAGRIVRLGAARRGPAALAQPGREAGARRGSAGTTGAKGIFVQARSKATLAEEQPEVYKDVEEVVEVAAGAGLARPVVRLRPLGGIKG